MEPVKQSVYPWRIATGRALAALALALMTAAPVVTVYAAETDLGPTAPAVDQSREPAYQPLAEDSGSERPIGPGPIKGQPNPGQPGPVADDSGSEAAPRGPIKKAMAPTRPLLVADDSGSESTSPSSPPSM